MASYIETTLQDGVEILVLKNEELEVWLTTLGASILKLIVRDRNGNPTDVALGYATLEDYPKYRAYLGATVGRTANRIAKGQFQLNGVDYQLPINNGPNCNHGGQDGFSFRNFQAHLQEDAVVFTLFSPDGEEGYPGNMEIRVTYRLAGSQLEIHYEAQADADTLASFTNHTYFNLSGHPGYIGDHLLQVNADAFGPVNGDGLFMGTFVPTAGTPMDFRQEKTIAQALQAEDEQIATALGLDHSFVLNTGKEPIVLYYEPNGIELRVSTTLPQAQLYTANYFGGEPGKYGEDLIRQSGIAIETQQCPDDIHVNAAHPKTLLKKGEKLDETTVFSFGIRK